jgi:hypothetical protein
MFGSPAASKKCILICCSGRQMYLFRSIAVPLIALFSALPVSPQAWATKSKVVPYFRKSAGLDPGGRFGGGFSCVAEAAYSDEAQVLRLSHTLLVGVRERMLIFKEYDGIHE